LSDAAFLGMISDPFAITETMIGLGCHWMGTTVATDCSIALSGFLSTK
jgi:hypothetical protein